MNKRLLSFLAVAAIFFIAFNRISYSNGVNVPGGFTNAPSDQNCTNAGCHTSFSLQTNLDERIHLTADGLELDANFKYEPGETYTMVFEIINPKPKNGFSLTVLNADNNFVGTLTAPGNPGARTSTANGKTYVGHSLSSSITSWTFDWTAPTDSQEVTFYGIANLSNASNTSLGDSILTIQKTITMASDTNGTAIYSRALLDNIQVVNHPSNKGLLFSINVTQAKNFLIELYTTTGEKVLTNQQFLHPGMQNIQLPVDANSGLYLLKVASEGKVASSKVILF